jgi:hypothetical protein
MKQEKRSNRFPISAFKTVQTYWCLILNKSALYGVFFIFVCVCVCVCVCVKGGILQELNHTKKV